MLLLLAACHHPTADTEPVPPPAWDPPAVTATCPADQPAALLDQALGEANIARDDLGWSEDEWSKSSYASVLDDAFLLPWIRDLQRAPLKVPCAATGREAALEAWGDDGRPATGAMWTAMDALGVTPPEAPLDPATAPTAAEGLAALIHETGGHAAEVTGLPEGLDPALGPIFAAMGEVVAAWKEARSMAPSDAASLGRYGAGGALLDTRTLPDLADPTVQQWVLAADGPRGMYGPTLRLLQAIETADLGRFAGQGAAGVLLDLPTDRGRVMVLGPGADAPGDLDPVLFLLDLGGDDTWVHGAGANPDDQPLSVMIDLGGNDTYGYEAVADPGDAGRLPSDADGRYEGDTAYGPFSLSHHGRQGSGRFGVGVLVDLGGGTDTYTSLRMSQGWGHLGVGVLVDDGGDDTYRGEAGVQGAASMGIGILVDGGGTDRRETYATSQGFAYVQGVGIAWDRGDGADAWLANPGDPDHGGDPLYYTPQLPGHANSSFVQGAGFGRRGDTDGAYLSGGFGLLLEDGGNDTYTAGVFGQGTGYWQGAGFLVDRGGNDRYDAFWYIQGGAAHYSIGALLDGGGNDRIDQEQMPVGVQMGSGHDFSIGVFVDEGGDDAYRYAALAAGSSNCQGTGIFVDNAGSDAYEALSNRSTGLGNQSDECNTGARAAVQDVGLFLDSGGAADTYAWPDTSRAPADDSSFGFDTNGLAAEHGAAIDGDGETAVHAVP